MQANPLLTIVIPTYHRAEFLDQCLKVNLPLLAPHRIAVAIVDNASPDDTEEVVRRHARQYPLLHYHRHETTVGIEDNVVFALKHPDTDYVWILADTYQVPEGGIDYILERIASPKGYDAVVLNLPGQKRDLSCRDFTDGDELLSSIGAVMTCLSCLIISRKVIDSADFARFRDTRFVQTGIIFEAIANRDFAIHFAQTVPMSSLVGFKENKNAWSKGPAVFDIACERWVNFVYSLPFCYSLASKERCILDLTEVSTIFSLPHLLMLRVDGVYNYEAYRKYRHLFPLTVKLPRPVLIAVALAPATLLRGALAAKRFLRKAARFFFSPLRQTSPAAVGVRDAMNQEKGSIA